MEYNNIAEGRFIARPNRFIAHIEINGKTEVVHVKNTGRCKELLVPNARVFVEESQNPMRKTKYDLISVYKGSKLINMDSQIPNKVFCEWAKKEWQPDFIKGEVTYNNSRLDFYLEKEGKKQFVEVKGVTLEEEGVAMFPDAPTLRGVKHLKELCLSVKEGYTAYVVFVIQMAEIMCFKPNANTHEEFATALKEAKNCGVNILAYNCNVTETSINIKDKIECYV